MEANGTKDERKKATVQSVNRAISILKCFDEKPELRITEISQMLGLHKSTTFGLISTLEQADFLEQDEDSGKYRLGLELLRLGLNVKSGLRSLAKPHLNELLSQFKETVNFVVRDGDDALYLEKLDSPHSMRIFTEQGRRLPMYCTAVGKSILAYLPQEELDEILSRTEFVAYTQNTLVSPDTLRNELDIIHAQGYAIDNEELEYGLVCVAAPIFDHNREPIAALSVSGPASRMECETIEQIRCALQQSTDAISKRLS